MLCNVFLNEKIPFLNRFSSRIMASIPDTLASVRSFGSQTTFPDPIIKTCIGTPANMRHSKDEEMYQVTEQGVPGPCDLKENTNVELVAQSEVEGEIKEKIEEEIKEEIEEVIEEEDSVRVLVTPGLNVKGLSKTEEVSYVTWLVSQATYIFWDFFDLLHGPRLLHDMDKPSIPVYYLSKFSHKGIKGFSTHRSYMVVSGTN